VKLTEVLAMKYTELLAVKLTEVLAMKYTELLAVKFMFAIRCVIKYVGRFRQ